jgi:four helix bundle protein
MKEYDIHERIFDYIVRTIKFLNRLPKTPTNVIFINQITRSVTSMGANDQEADGALTRKDFIHKFTIVRKESKETIFWLRIIKETNHSKYDEEVLSLVAEGKEIVAIISTIIKNTSRSSKEKNDW